jgi:uncharacterized protein YicC (UPF0701 family)
MHKITNKFELKEAIQQLEHKKNIEGVELKKSIHQALENLQPINVIKNTLHDLVSSTEIKENLTDIAIGATSGMIVKSLVVGKTDSPISNITGSLVEMFVAKNVTKHMDSFKKLGLKLFS